DAHEQDDPIRVHPARRREDLAPGASAGEPERRHGSPRGPREQVENEKDEPGEDEGELHRVVHELDERPRSVRHGAAEEIGTRRAEHAASWNRVTPVAPILGPGDRVRPLRLEVWAGRAVEEGRLELSPAALEFGPRIRGLRLRRCTGNRLDHWTDVNSRPARVVAAHAFL